MEEVCSQKFTEVSSFSSRPKQKLCMEELAKSLGKYHFSPGEIFQVRTVHFVQGRDWKEFLFVSIQTTVALTMQWCACRARDFVCFNRNDGDHAGRYARAGASVRSTFPATNARTAAGGGQRIFASAKAGASIVTTAQGYAASVDHMLYDVQCSACRND
jgi:hypothetical protein